ncbi:MAG: hypothetical protein IT440_10910 [Phycisphaeraceae bacterium]|nr:hypothetical protein [Phycisphaeraceae bacterium]
MSPSRMQWKGLSASALCVMVVGVALVGWLWPLNLPTSPSVTAEPAKDQPGDSSQPAAQPSLSMRDFERFWSMQLRPAASVPAPNIASPAEPTAPSAPVVATRLVGTLIENGRSMGVFVTANKELKLVQVGETVDNLTVVAVEPDRVQVSRDGVTSYLERVDAQLSPPLPEPRMLGVRRRTLGR